MKSKKKIRLDQFLLQEGYFTDVKVAQSWIIQGKVVINDRVLTKPGELIKTSDAEKVHLRGYELKFASRGGYKLEAAITRFNLDITDMVALDAGACTGGFTDCLLQNGAKHVYSVDVGYGQLKGRLANDDRVSNIEKTNIGDLSIERLNPPIDICSADLSYLSLTQACNILKKLFQKPAKMICLVKPLFEGITIEDMDNTKALMEILEKLFISLEEQNLYVKNVTVSPILGNNQLVEFLILLEETKSQKTAKEWSNMAIAEFEKHPPVSNPIDLV